jgi:hypothetical protein
MPVRFSFAVIALATSAFLISPTTAEEKTATPAAAAPIATAKDAGARYGQALGAVEVCFGSKVTDKAKALEGSYTGGDQEVFKAQAAKIFEAWHKVKACADQVDPNRCKIAMDKSCLAAEAEIGSAGTAMPGLVEFVKH